MNIFTKPDFDETIVSAQWHTYSPFINSFNESDIINIQIQNQNINIKPSTSYLYIEGEVKIKDTANPVERTQLINNAIPFLFNEIKYELNGIEIDHNRNVGITSALKNYISLNQNESNSLYCSSWSPNLLISLTQGKFAFSVPLNRLLGFAEDYKNFIPNCKHELILTRSRTNDNSMFCAANIDAPEVPELKITKLCWEVQHIQLSDLPKLNLLKSINTGHTIHIAFRSWELHEYPTLPTTQHHIWNVRTTSQLEKPRYIILALQTDKQHQITKDPSKFDNCNITSLKVHLNSEVYPYEDIHLDFDSNRYSRAYEMYNNFRYNYYNSSTLESLTSWSNFKAETPIFIIDTRYQNDNLKQGPVDVKIELKASKDIPPRTTAFCLILHDCLVELKPLTGEVNKLS
jgi:hypothetical protein